MTSGFEGAAVSPMCDDAEIAAIAQVLKDQGEPPLQRLADALQLWPEDYRLWFLRGSVNTSEQRNDEARADFTETLRLAPTFSIATFMLGFLELVSGHVDKAVQTWKGLDNLADDDALRAIRNGLLDLCDDRFDVAYEALRRGMALNIAHPILNRYVRAVVDRVGSRCSARAELESSPSNHEGSHLLLTSYLGSNTRH
ncbi:tetratricopeptide repeat protein [Paraburkholderia sp. IW21]|uniref:tetratricopeptide repeat protein n=1 Tax=Paraburkholderia sp. IW21 TaxID=3242488 RepID=UPI0035225A81